MFNHGNGKIRKDWWDLTPNAGSPNLMPYSVEGKEIMRGQGFLYNRKNIIDPNGFDMRGLFFVATCKRCSDHMSWLLNVHTNGVTRVCEAPLLDYIWNSLQKSVLGDRVEKPHQIVVDATQCDFSWRCLQKSVKFLPYLWSGQLSRSLRPLLLQHRIYCFGHCF